MVFVQVIVSLLLVVVILMQKSKSQGIGMAFGGGMGESLFGSQVGNVLTKITVALAAIFLVNTALLAFTHGDNGIPAASVTEIEPDEAPAQPTLPATDPATDAPVVPPPAAPPVEDMEPPPMDVPLETPDVDVGPPADVDFEMPAPVNDEEAAFEEPANG